VERFTEHKRPVMAVAVSPDGKYALSVGSDNTIQRSALERKAP
jgi:hypothetical protein